MQRTGIMLFYKMYQTYDIMTLFLEANSSMQFFLLFLNLAVWNGIWLEIGTKTAWKRTETIVSIIFFGIGIGAGNLKYENGIEYENIAKTVTDIYHNRKPLTEFFKLTKSVAHYFSKIINRHFYIFLSILNIIRLVVRFTYHKNQSYIHLYL